MTEKENEAFLNKCIHKDKRDLHMDKTWLTKVFYLIINKFVM